MKINCQIYNKIFFFTLFFLFLSDITVANPNNKSNGNLDTGNLYENAWDNVLEPVWEDVYVDVWSNAEESILLEDGVYDKFLEKVSKVDPSARHKFSAYYSNWYYSGQKNDFNTYAQLRAEKEKRIDYCYDKIIAKFGIGTGIVASTWIVAFILPGGSIYQAAVLVVAKYGAIGGASGALISGVISLGQAIIEGKTGDDLIYDTLNGAADGYLIGVITGEISGIAKVSSLMKEAKSISSAGKTVFQNKVYDANGKYLAPLKGDLKEINGRAIINQELVGTVNTNGIPYKWYLMDDGNGNFFRVVNPDFTNIQIINKTYHIPKKYWNNFDKCKELLNQEYIRDLSSPNVEKLLGISKQEAAMRIQFEKGLDLNDIVFKKANNLTETQITDFLTRYDKGSWHHLPSSGDFIYVPKNHYQLAPHTGGNSFWGEKTEATLLLEDIKW